MKRKQLFKYFPTLFCVDCGGLISNLCCSSCNRQYKKIDEIPLLLSTEDENSDLFKRYLKNYSQIANDYITEKNTTPPLYFRKAQTDKMLSYCGSGIKSKIVLDLGSGDGLFLKKVPHNNKVGVDISLEYLSIIKGYGINAVFANAEKLPFKNEFDLIIVNDILEHVLKPEAVLESIKKALKINGETFIRIPYKEDLSQYSIESGCNYEFVHLRSFDDKIIKKYIDESGLVIKKIMYDGFSISRAKVDSPNLVIRILSKLIRRYFRILSLDRYICKLPNRIGTVFFHPYEILVQASNQGE
jgi:SAM-dependent methyltransferase